jgi:endonuclease G
MNPGPWPRSQIDQIRALVRSGDIDLAISALIDFLKGIAARELNEAVILAARFNDVRRRERMGILSSNEGTVERSRVAAAILEIVDEISRYSERVASQSGFHPISLDPPPDNQLEKIFGTNHLKSVAWLARGLEVARSVCRIVNDAGLGSGFLVGAKYVLTNWHVIPNAAVARSTKVQFNYEEDLHGYPTPIQEYRVEAERVWADESLDISMVELAASCDELARWGTATVAVTPVPKAGDHVTIIQHPNGGPKQIALTANQVVNLYEHRLQYTTDTLPGSSGSPVFDDRWKVIALHRAGGNLVSNARGDRMFANEGVMMDAALRCLAGLGAPAGFES